MGQPWVSDDAIVFTSLSNYNNNNINIYKVGQYEFEF